ncbi:GDP-mannose 4,6-dehydratase [Rubellicoccus peritrichatus]|uniref:GDP-mannose 4,6-dehydratase n=1 Tax=Rubellicoccus peritrichatus TaxID=3080537 RepID=A0AAQ3LCG7_9BACT|nr:GDP-mannose 4,6-dehydratase [Puniceicoccus sp. CR14]WOO42911.1 GDP-mannose 4,6-dehydratase [Puniceicoccus sp. CR14]
MKKAFITGITGQDGSYLTEFLLSKGYEVHGLVRRTSSMDRSRIDLMMDVTEEQRKKMYLHYGDLGDSNSLSRLLSETRPDEVYNLASQSHVRVSFDMPEFTTDINATGTIRLLEAIRSAGLIHKVRYYQASSSEMFGKIVESPLRETTQFRPRSPYACSKVFAHFATVNYRDAYGLFACNGILFNHESPRRGENFVTRKITLSAARIKLGLQESLSLGNLNACRDWGYAKEYAESMWQMLQHDTPDDYVIATGESHSVQDFVSEAFAAVDLDWRDYVTFDQRLIRASEVDDIIGDPSKAQRVLGWEAKVRFSELVNLMVEADLDRHKMSNASS